MSEISRPVLIAIIAGGSLLVGLLIWLFIIRDNSADTEIISHVMSDNPEVIDDAPEGYDRYFNAEFGLEFFYPEEWALIDREFGEVQPIVAADIPLASNDFDIHYFAEDDARVVLDVGAERYCQQTKKLKTWDAFEGAETPEEVTDKQCAAPEQRMINDHRTYTFLGRTDATARYSVFVPLLGAEGGLVFSASKDFDAEATAVVAGHTVDSLKTTVHERVVFFARENQTLLEMPKPETESGL